MQVSLKSVDISVFYAREVSIYRKQRSKKSFGAPSISQLKIISSFILEKLFVMPKKHIKSARPPTCLTLKFFRPRGLNLLTIHWCCAVFVAQCDIGPSGAELLMLGLNACLLSSLFAFTLQHDPGSNKRKATNILNITNSRDLRSAPIMIYST